MADAAVIVENVSKRFRLYHERNQSLKAAVMRGRRARVEEFWALDDVSFEVPTGTTFGLIGENGSGKSTMLKCIAKILRPDKGSVTVNGKISALLELGAGFHPELSGRENVFLNGAILGLKQKELERRFDDIVDFAGIGQFIDQPVKNYSSGMYVRLGFSVAINVDPDVLLVDEVLSVGDEAFQRKCNEKFADLRAQGKTIVLVSHAMSSVQNLCDQVAWFDDGGLKAIGPASDVIDDYLGGVSAERTVQQVEENRWGTGEATIDHFELLDAKGESVTRVRTGETVTFRLHYTVSSRIERPVFGVLIQTLEGVHVSGPTTRDGGLVPEVLEGNGVVDLTFERLMLLPGTYDVSTAIYDYGILSPFDSRHKILRFDVDFGAPREHYGVVALGGSWKISDALPRA